MVTEHIRIPVPVFHRIISYNVAVTKPRSGPDEAGGNSMSASGDHKAPVVRSDFGSDRDRAGLRRQCLGWRGFLPSYVRTDGTLSGHRWSIEGKSASLEREGT